MNGRVFGAWRSRVHAHDTSGAVYVRDIEAADRGEAMSIGAASQRTVLSASTRDATLVVWGDVGPEEQTFHAGLRERDGSWSEDVVLPQGQTPVAVASSDSRFALVMRDAQQHDIIVILDERGHEAARSVTLPLTVTGVTYSGNQCVAVDLADSNVAAVGASPSAALTPLRLIQPSDRYSSYQQVSVASNGTNLMVVWDAFGSCFRCSVTTTTVGGTTLTADLLRDHASNFTVGTHPSYGSSVVWDGDAYTVVWKDGSSTRYWRRLRPDGTFINTPQLISQDLTYSDLPPRVQALSGGIGIADEGRDLFLAHDGTVLADISIATSRPGVWTPLPGHIAALLTAERIVDAPYYGSERLSMRVVDTAPLPDVPAAPSVVALLNGSIVHVDWTAPPQPVNGYRVEYRIDDDVWTEVEAWYPRGTQTADLPIGKRGSTIAVRVRAFSDAGVSAPSQPAVALPTRRRAVR